MSGCCFCREANRVGEDVLFSVCYKFAFWEYSFKGQMQELNGFVLLLKKKMMSIANLSSVHGENLIKL